MITIKDVAKMAKVSVATASNALTGKTGVKLETKRRVLEVAKTLNYIPNPMAQNLVSRSTRNISIIVSGPTANIFSNPVVIEIIKSINQILDEKGYYALLNMIDLQRESEIPRIAQSRSSDALILIGSRSNDRELETLFENISIPAVIVNRNPPSSNAYSVSVDNKKCGYIATRYLIDMGHRRIGYIGSFPGVGRAEERLAGYRQALTEAGIDYDESLVVKEDFFQESGFMGIRKLLNQCGRRPTAVFSFNDIMALGAMEALQQEGIRVPEDISLIGCDNIPNLHLLKVPLTTVSSPFAEIGRLAAKKIVGVLEGNDEMPPKLVLDSELRIRNSVCRV